MEELWRPVADYNYMREDGSYVFEVSSLGMVRKAAYVDECGIAHSASEFLPQNVDSRGFYRVMLWNKITKPKLFLVHQLVAQAFLYNPSCATRVAHLDGDNSNNCVSNLKWIAKSRRR